MARTLSATAVAALMAQETSEVFLGLLTLSHPDLSPPIRIVNDTVNVTSRGNIYIAFPYRLEMPWERDDELPQVTLEIDNVDRTIVQAVRALSARKDLTALFEVVLASSPDTVELAELFTLRGAEYDALVVRGRLQFEDVLNEPFPADSFTPATTPGIF
jgi:hypothetical protein